MRIYAPKWVVIDSAGNAVAGFEDKTSGQGYVSILNFDISIASHYKPFRVRPNDREWWREAEYQLAMDDCANRSALPNREA